MKKITQEIVSLNEELISFDSGDIGVEALEQRLELTLGGNHGCIGFTCNGYNGCPVFSCQVFNP